jgi:hypothetical protein
MSREIYSNHPPQQPVSQNEDGNQLVYTITTPPRFEFSQSPGEVEMKAPQGGRPYFRHPVEDKRVQAGMGVRYSVGNGSEYKGMSPAQRKLEQIVAKRNASHRIRASERYGHTVPEQDHVITEEDLVAAATLRRVLKRKQPVQATLKTVGGVPAENLAPELQDLLPFRPITVDYRSPVLEVIDPPVNNVKN